MTIKILIGSLLVGFCFSSVALANNRCLRELKRNDVSFQRVDKKHIDEGVKISGEIGDVLYQSQTQQDLIIDCPLAYALSRLSPLLRSMGITKVIWSSAYDIRKIRGTKKYSRHSFGLAIDIVGVEHEGKIFRVSDHYEQGLGNKNNCIGEPLTKGGAILRSMFCQWDASGLFRIILTPDYDAGHYHHFHVEVDPNRLK